MSFLDPQHFRRYIGWCEDDLEYESIKFFVYLLRCSDGSLYCGWTNNLDCRLTAHNTGKGAKYTRSRRPVELIYFEECESKRAAMRREWQVKRLSREEKLRLIGR